MTQAPPKLPTICNWPRKNGLLEDDRQLIDRLIQHKIAEHMARKERNPDLPRPKPILCEEIEARQIKIVVIAPAFDSYPILIPSLQYQTYPNWQLMIVHDGPATPQFREYTKATNDSRISFLETNVRANDWGHTPRKYAFERLQKSLEGHFLLVTNSDNYYVPGFLECMLNSVTENSFAVFCDMVHDYYGWELIPTKLEYSHFDCGCLMVRLDIALDVGWRSTLYEADWVFVHDIIQRYGAEGFSKAPYPLFVHN